MDEETQSQRHLCLTLNHKKSMADSLQQYVKETQSYKALRETIKARISPTSSYRK